MKRLLGLLLAVMVMLFSTTAFAANYWTKTWAQGEYTITLTAEDEAAIADLWPKGLSGRLCGRALIIIR